MTNHHMINFQINEKKLYGTSNEGNKIETRRYTRVKMLFYLSVEKGNKLYSRRKEGRNSKWLIWR